MNQEVPHLTTYCINLTFVKIKNEYLLHYLTV